MKTVVQIIHSSINIRLTWLAVICLFTTIPVFAGQSVVKTTDDSFYVKFLDADGIAIKAGEVVSDRAMCEAKARIDRMLKHIPAVRKNLAGIGAELHIIGKDQKTSDLPEYRYLKGKPFDGSLTIDERTRGLGGLFTSCGEENLLKIPNDRYFGRDILVHEFAHNLYNNGIPASVKKQFEARFSDATAGGLWVKSYAATNPNEFFAELSMWYFGTHGDLGMTGQPPDNGAEGLRQYDKDSFRLFDDLYMGRVPNLDLARESLKPIPVAMESQTRSMSGTQSARVLLVNTTSHDLRKYWIDYGGKRVDYGRLLKYSTDTFETYSTHAWLLTDESDRPVLLFTAVPGDCWIKITETDAGTLPMKPAELTQ